MPGQGDVARRRAPMLRMVEISLIEGAALAAIDRPGVAVAELVEIRRVEIDCLALAAVELDRKVGAVDRLDRAGSAIVKAGLLVGRGELDAVASSKGVPAMCSRQLM